MQLSFEDWCKKLNKVSIKNGGIKDLVEETGEDAWYEYWKNGYKPEEAYFEDMSYE